MSVKLTAPNGEEYDTSNGEWLAITAMGEAFGILHKWNACHNCRTFYTPEELQKLAYRARQIGKAADRLEEMAEDGGVLIS